MDSSTLTIIVIALFGTLFTILLSSVVYFLKILHNDLKQAIKDIESNSTQIEMNKSQQEHDVKRMEETTQLKIGYLGDEVSSLAASVERFVELTIEKQKSDA